MRKAIYPGSFDPITHGHLDVIQRAAGLFEKVLVAVAQNNQKNTLFTAEERMGLIEEVTRDFPNVEVTRFRGLLVDFAQRENAQVVIRGLRAISDFEFEFQMALMNRKLSADIETIFLMPKEEYTYLSSSIVKEVAQLGGDITPFVPQPVENMLKQKFVSS